MFGGIRAKIFRPENSYRSAADGKLRFEIDDRNARMLFDEEIEYTHLAKLDGKTVKLAQILDHPELYRAYPELKEMKVNFRIGGPNSFISSSQAINLDPHEAHLALFHEVQHAVQDIEGFAAGTDPKKVAAWRAQEKAEGLKKSIKLSHAHDAKTGGNHAAARTRMHALLEEIQTHDWKKTLPPTQVRSTV